MAIFRSFAFKYSSVVYRKRLFSSMTDVSKTIRIFFKHQTVFACFSISTFYIFTPFYPSTLIFFRITYFPICLFFPLRSVHFDYLLYFFFSAFPSSYFFLSILYKTRENHNSERMLDEIIRFFSIGCFARDDIQICVCLCGIWCAYKFLCNWTAQQRRNFRVLCKKFCVPHKLCVRVHCWKRWNWDFDGKPFHTRCTPLFITANLMHCNLIWFVSKCFCTIKLDYYRQNRVALQLQSIDQTSAIFIDCNWIWDLISSQFFSCWFVFFFSTSQIRSIAHSSSSGFRCTVSFPYNSHFQYNCKLMAERVEIGFCVVAIALQFIFCHFIVFVLVSSV